MQESYVGMHKVNICYWIVGPRRLVLLLVNTVLLCCGQRSRMSYVTGPRVHETFCTGRGVGAV